MNKDIVIIIGAGIIGTSIARELSKYSNLDIKILDKEWDVSQGTTKANSGIIHAGYDDDLELYPVRANLCSKGNRLWHNLADDLEIPVRWIGSMLVALKPEEIDVLEELYERGTKNGVPGLRVLDKEEARKKEPNIPNIEGALYAPTEGVISPYEAAIALAENATDNGVDICLDEEVTSIENGNKGFEITTKRNKFIADWVINAAGLYGDKISHLAGVDKSNQGTDLKIHPRKGEYWIFEQEIGSPVNSIIFPIPTPTSKGILIFPSADENLIIGPNSRDLPNDRKEDKSTTTMGMEEVYNKAKEIVPVIPPKNRCIKNYAGLRAELPNADFVIESYRQITGFINVIGIRSPGIASAPAIAEKVIELMKDLGFQPREKTEFNPRRRKIPRFNELSIEDKERLIREDWRYSHLICWCEGVTEGEIVEAIKRGARTVEGVSFRTRASMGRCQGGSCLPRIVSILSQELKIPEEEITFKTKEDRLFVGRLKE